jgi:outer membrane receptor protein involved in Fe transport
MDSTDSPSPGCARETRPAVIADVVLSGQAPRFNLRYAVGVYNLFDWRYSVPAGDLFASRSIAQNGRTFALNVSVGF